MRKLIQTLKSPVEVHLKIPGSKSLTNRALLLAALAEGESTLYDMLLSDDTRAMISALKELGVSIRVNEKLNVCTVIGCKGQFPKTAAFLNCVQAGTVARFLLAVCAASAGRYVFDASERLRQRPIAALLEVICAQGATLFPSNARCMPFVVQGANRLHGGKIVIDSQESSQFLSALLMAAPLAKSTVHLQTEKIVSAPYVDMTCKVMSDFGVLVKRESPHNFAVAIPQHYAACEYRVEPDLSTASYFFAAAALTKSKLTIQPIQRNAVKQGDVAFISVLEQMGCFVRESSSGLTVQGPEKLKGVEVNMNDFSDTFMTLAVLAPFATTPTTITNIAHTRLQESDRISVVRKNLESLNVPVEEMHDSITIYPAKPIGSVINSYQDHRIAMAFSIMGLCVPGIEIKDVECVTKTCPTFFDLLEHQFMG